MKCNNCGHEISNNALFCDNCGHAVLMTEEVQTKSFCGSCGAEIESGMKFCGECGAQINPNGTPIPMQQTRRQAYQECSAQKKKSSVFGIVITIVLILVILGGGVWIGFNILYNGSDDDDDVQMPNTTQSVSASLLPQASSAPTVMPVSSSAPTLTPTSEYLFNSNTEYITETYLNTKSQSEVRYILNEIYARHGYIFTTDEYKTYFSSKSWYVPKHSSAEDAEGYFNEVEQSNKTTIVNYETSKGWR